MSKTIDEAAREFAENADYPVGESDYYDSFYKQAESCISDAFKAGTSHVLSLPLSERLTEDEKEAIRAEFWQAAKDWIGVGDARWYCKTCVALERIFGKEMFEKEGE